MKDFGWKPVRINLKPGEVDVKEKWTKEVCLESFPLDFSTDADKILSLEKCDQEIISSLRKSRLEEDQAKGTKNQVTKFGKT
ncbi:unnamed protein product [Pseudo-nitzschia multistriata]|uniref:Uncharacterized protein n=1 Tax=Pseudo-nitzschia multistriata TaxID=183589 RepID=A0A448ZD68_9STRA|nr:unnamed protein product [Pseudo-nitzschia multistriata]